MKNKIREFVCSTFLVEFGEDVFDDTDLFKAGIMDSFGYLQLIRFLEETFGITYTDEEMLMDILVSFNRIVASVESKRVKG